MLFNSYEFVFLVIVTLMFYYTKQFKNYQIQILIFASFIFYAYGQPLLLVLLFISASINAIVSYKVFYTSIKKKKKIYAIFGVIINLFVLSFFKYSPLLGNTINSYFNYESVGGFLISIPLPIGISFYTFQGISLVIDLYRNNKQNECPIFHVDSDFKTHYII